jgi:hypothetical protein
MAWVKLDDGFWHHRKVRKAWREPRAVGLWAMALAHVNEAEQDGFVDPEWIEDQIPDADERARVIAALVDAGLWRECNDGWEFHDYHDYQPSAAKIAEVREARRMAGKLGGAASGRSRRNGGQS